MPCDPNIVQHILVASPSSSCYSLTQTFFFFCIDCTHLDSLLHEQNSNQHAKKFACYSSKPIDYSTRIEYCKKEQQKSCPDTNPAAVTRKMNESKNPNIRNNFKQVTKQISNTIQPTPRRVFALILPFLWQSCTDKCTL